jgi:polyhydroxyalkanoate synthesis regulator phasin
MNERLSGGDPKQAKPLPLREILELESDDLRKRYPHGADVGGAAGSGMYVPATQVRRIGRISLKELQERRKYEAEKAVFMDRNPSRPLTEDMMRRAKGTEQCVPKTVVDEFANKSRAQFEVIRGGEHQQRLSQVDSLERQLTEAIAVARERGVDVHADIQFIRRRLERMKEKLQKAS